MQQLSSLNSLRILAPQIMGINQPRRKLLPLTPSNNAFVKPVKQSFVEIPYDAANALYGTYVAWLGWSGASYRDDYRHYSQEGRQITPSGVPLSTRYD